MEKHFCMNCGREFEAENAMVRYCPECAAKKKAQQREKQKVYAKERQAKLMLTNISIYKTDKEYLLGLAQDKKVTMAEIIKEIVDNLRRQAGKQAAETETKTEKANTKKAAAKSKTTKKVN